MPQPETPGNLPEASHFSPALFKFLRELKAHNDREWFQANKARFEHEVKGPMLAFIAAFAAPLAGINKHYFADPRPVGGSMFRINRDTRFAHDKSPYKTNVGAHFRHRDCTRDVHCPAFYLHLEPGECFVGAGIWHPDPESLRKVRDRIVAQPRAWKALKARGIEAQGEALQRVPQGYDPGSPFAEDLKLKDFYTYTPITDREVCAPDFLDRYAEACRQGAPLVAFLTKALELPW
jgi:uncharacterized protein (TIGR02453 family)